MPWETLPYYLSTLQICTDGIIHPPWVILSIPISPNIICDMQCLHKACFGFFLKELCPWCSLSMLAKWDLRNGLGSSSGRWRVYECHESCGSFFHNLAPALQEVSCPALTSGPFWYKPLSCLGAELAIPSHLGASDFVSWVGNHHQMEIFVGSAPQAMLIQHFINDLKDTRTQKSLQLLQLITGLAVL